MKKQKLKNLLKLGILTFGISLLLTNCNKNEDIAPQETQQERTITEISFEDFKSNSNLNNQFQNLNKTFNEVKLSSKNNLSQKSSSGFKDATILTDNIIKIKKEGFITYTFTILTQTENDDFYNLVLYVNDNQEIYKSHILKYTPSEKWLADTNKHFSGNVKIVGNDVFNVNDLLQSKSSVSAKSSQLDDCIDVRVTYECSNGVEGHQESPRNSSCHAADFYVYYDIYSYPCSGGSGDDGGQIDPYDNPGNGNGNGGGGGGGGSDDDGGIVTAPNTVPYTWDIKNFESGFLNTDERNYYHSDSNIKNTVDRHLIDNSINNDFTQLSQNEVKAALNFGDKLNLNSQQFIWGFNNRNSEDFADINNYLSEIITITPKIENFIKKVINSEIETNNNAEVDFEEQIINELTGKALCVYNKLKSSSTGFKNAIKKFEAEFPVAHLKFEADATMSSNTKKAYTRAPENYVIDIVLNGNPIKDASYQKRPNLLVAKTIIHEVIHAEMFRKLLSLANNNGSIDVSLVNQMLLQGDYPGMLDYYFRNGSDINSNWQHQQIAAHYRETIARILQEFDTGTAIPDNQQSQQLYLDLSWEGLIYSNITAWQEIMDDTERTRIENVISNYINNNLNQTCTE
ncbi:hypothetical protein RCH18_003183 [Flavobacterium sp. PL11]|uniref:hypothetical protein n=1 Tax=Flavobacterium sp. PL11 TaxID=3071717 RepID=UPI002DFEB309|nr:hypothetical protein [Flavobacterium sp. PL11]